MVFHIVVSRPARSGRGDASADSRQYDGDARRQSRGNIARQRSMAGGGCRPPAALSPPTFLCQVPLPIAFSPGFDRMTKKQSNLISFSQMTIETIRCQL